MKNIAEDESWPLTAISMSTVVHDNDDQNDDDDDDDGRLCDDLL